MKNFILKNPFVLGVVFLVIGLLGYQELKSFVFGFSALSIAENLKQAPPIPFFKLGFPHYFQDS